MKKNKIAAAFMIAAAIGVTALTACNGSCSANKQGEFDISQYAVPYKTAFVEKENVRPSYSHVTETDFTDLQSLSGNFAKGTKPDGTYSLYDLEEERELFSSLSQISARTAGTVSYYETVSADGSYGYVGPDGKAITDKTFKSPSSFSLTPAGEGYIGGRLAKIFEAEYPQDENVPANKTKEYFALYNGSNGNVWEKVSLNDISFAPGSTAGGFSAPQTYIVDGNAYPACNTCGYRYTLENLAGGGGKYTFYGKDGKKLGTETLYGNCSPVAFVDNYFYYYELTAVREDATKHYNIEFVTEYDTFKVNYVLYRYDFTSPDGKTEEVSTDYAVLTGVYGAECIPLYNYSENKFDKFYACAYKKVDGIAVIGENSHCYRMVFGEDMSICADLTGSGLDLSEVYDLGGGRYLSGNRIYDKNFDLTAVLPEGDITLLAEQGLILCGNVVIDRDGNIKFSSLPRDFEIYGAAAASGQTVYNSRNPAGISAAEFVGADGSGAGRSGGIIYKSTDAGYEIYDLEGERIGVIAGVTSSAFNPVRMGGKLVFSAQGKVWLIG